jgi:hypothetical protein
MKVQVIVATAVVALFASQTKAATIPYQNIGFTVAPYTVTAVNTGAVDAWFYGESAGDSDSVKVIDLTHPAASGWFFPNQTTAVGAEITGVIDVTAGDTLEFQLYNWNTSTTLSSIPSHSADGINHFYATPWTGGDIPATSVSVPTTIDGAPVFFLGAEDLSLKQGTDRDYNDDQFLFDNVTFSKTPEPGSLYLLGSGLVGLAGMVRRKLRA